MTAQSQRLGRDHGDERARAGAEVLRADAHDDAAIRRDFAVRRRGSAAAAAPRVDRDAHAGLDRAGSLVAGRMPLVPAEFRGALLQVRAPHRIRRLRRQVLDPELDRIHLHLVRELVHHDLGDERTLRMSGRAHRALLAGVDEDVLVRAAAIRDLINVRQREAGGGARAARAPRLGLERGDHAVGRDAGFDLRCRRRPIAGRQMLFLAIEHQLDRRIGRLGELGADQPFGADAQRLAAEAAAHVLADDAHVGLRNAQRAGEVLPRAVDPLRRDPRRQLVAVPLADRAVRLQADVRDDVRRVGLLDRVRRRLEAGREIARFLRPAMRARCRR